MVNIIISILFVLLNCFPAFAEGPYSVGGEIYFDTVANLPSGYAGQTQGVTDGSTVADCTTGGGTNYNICIYNGTGWIIAGDGTSAGGGNSIFFEDSGASVGDNALADIYLDAIGLVTLGCTGPNCSLDIDWANLILQSEGVNWTDIKIQTSGVNWDSFEVQGNNINWASIEIQHDYINWTSLEGNINASGINWQTIPNYAQGRMLYADTNNAIGVNWDTAPEGGTGTGTDDQKIDVFSVSGNNIQLSLEDDGEATKTVDVSSTTAVVANTLKVTNATHTGEVTGSVALTISDGVSVDGWRLTGSTSFGTNDTSAAVVYLYGDNADTGAILRMYNSVNEDTTEDWWQFTAAGDTQFNLGIDGTLDVFKFYNSGNFSTIGNISGITYGSDASVSDAELKYINTLSSNAQTQLNGKQDTLLFTPAPSTVDFLVGTASGSLSAEEVVSANGLSLVKAANYAAMRGLLDLEAGTDFYSKSAIDTDFAFSSFPTTPAAAPDANYEVANKKYVDDNSGGSTGDFTFTGSEMSTSNGTISFDDEDLITTGSITINADNKALYFGASQDASIYYDATETDLVITTPSDTLQLITNEVKIVDPDGEGTPTFDLGEDASIYYDGTDVTIYNSTGRVDIITTSDASIYFDAGVDSRITADPCPAWLALGECPTLYWSSGGFFCYCDEAGIDKLFSSDGACTY